MATTKELAKEYYKRLEAAFDKKAEGEAIWVEINKLTWNSTGDSLSAKDKLSILKDIEEWAHGGPGPGGLSSVRAGDNSAIIDVIHALRNRGG